MQDVTRRKTRSVNRHEKLANVLNSTNLRKKSARRKGWQQSFEPRKEEKERGKKRREEL